MHKQWILKSWNVCYMYLTLLHVFDITRLKFMLQSFKNAFVSYNFSAGSKTFQVSWCGAPRGGRGGRHPASRQVKMVSGSGHRGRALFHKLHLCPGWLSDFKNTHLKRSMMFYVIDNTYLCFAPCWNIFGHQFTLYFRFDMSLECWMDGIASRPFG